MTRGLRCARQAHRRFTSSEVNGLEDVLIWSFAVSLSKGNRNKGNATFHISECNCIVGLEVQVLFIWSSHALSLPPS